MKETTYTHALVGLICSGGWLAWGVIIGIHSAPTTTEIIERIEQPSLISWEKLQMAIIKTECEWDSLAVGKQKDLGIFQITPIYVDEVNRILGEENYNHLDALNAEKSVKMFSIYQNHKNPTLDTDKAIRLHNPNGGYTYAVKVKKNLDMIEMYERYRHLVKSL